MIPELSAFSRHVFHPREFGKLWILLLFNLPAEGCQAYIRLRLHILSLLWPARRSSSVLYYPLRAFFFPRLLERRLPLSNYLPGSTTARHPISIFGPKTTSCTQHRSPNQPDVAWTMYKQKFIYNDIKVDGVEVENIHIYKRYR
jgi:hypothetical protein